MYSLMKLLWVTLNILSLTSEGRNSFTFLSLAPTSVHCMLWSCPQLAIGSQHDTVLLNLSFLIYEMGLVMFIRFAFPNELRQTEMKLPPFPLLLFSITTAKHKTKCSHRNCVLFSLGCFHFSHLHISASMPAYIPEHSVLYGI